MFLIEKFPSELLDRANAPLINGILRGIEREALRVDPSGKLSQRSHPQRLGSALTHPHITTDFSEALLEFITAPTHSVSELFCQLETIHRYVVSALDNELLWTASMPCALPETEDDIPVARYGDSHNGRMKTIYRVGLGHRYGRSMQTVSGIHYNFSLPNAFWAYFHNKEGSLLSLEDYKNTRYFSLIRNFRRHYWLLILLFGASPAMCNSFVGKRKHDLELHPKSHALYRPYATSLRMGDLGYQSSAQESLFICYNEKSTYIKTLANAILESHPVYASEPVKDEHGQYRHLNQGLLQIENEFYSSIRPKRSAKPGETALTALHRRGVEYIEVRCLDVNPFTPFGITKEQVAFLDTFLLYCALADSPLSNDQEFAHILQNQKKIVNYGRQPGLELEHEEFGKLTVETWANKLIEAMEPVAELLDHCYENTSFSDSLKKQQNCVRDLSLTPSAKILEKLDQQAASYPTMSLKLAEQNNLTLRDKSLSDAAKEHFNVLTDASLAEQKQIEKQSTGSFDQFLEKYYKQYEELR